MAKRLIAIGMSIWIPIWIFSYTNLAKTILNNPDNIVIAITALFLMVTGILLMFIGFFKYMRL